MLAVSGRVLQPPERGLYWGSFSSVCVSTFGDHTGHRGSRSRVLLREVENETLLAFVADPDRIVPRGCRHAESAYADCGKGSARGRSEGPPAR